MRCKGKRRFARGRGMMSRTKNNRLMFQGQCGTCGTRMNRFVGAKEGAGLLSALGLPIPDFLKNIPLLGNLLF